MLFIKKDELYPKINLDKVNSYYTYINANNNTFKITFIFSNTEKDWSFNNKEELKKASESIEKLVNIKDININTITI